MQAFNIYLFNYCILNILLPLQIHCACIHLYHVLSQKPDLAIQPPVYRGWWEPLAGDQRDGRTHSAPSLRGCFGLIALGRLCSWTEGHRSTQGGPLLMTLSPYPLALQVATVQTISRLRIQQYSLWFSSKLFLSL